MVWHVYSSICDYQNKFLIMSLWRWHLDPTAHALTGLWREIMTFFLRITHLITTITVTHYSDVIMRAIASQMTHVSMVYSTFVRAHIKENLKAPCHWLCGGISPMAGESPAQRASNAQNISIWWRHDVFHFRQVVLVDTIFYIVKWQYFQMHTQKGNKSSGIFIF